MKKLLSVLAALALATPALADPEIKRWNTPHAMGCMLVKDCTDNVVNITSTKDLDQFYPGSPYETIAEEFDDILTELRRVGVGVYVADGKYFPRAHRGVYYTVGNDFFLNVEYIYDPQVLLDVTRHEGWHAAQDCMAGDINNNSIAVIWADGIVPQEYYMRADIAYSATPGVIPWEAEAMYASEQPYMTANALRACQAKDDMWSIYPPTPKTGEWLIKNGYWNGIPK